MASEPVHTDGAEEGLLVDEEGGEKKEGMEEEGSCAKSHVFSLFTSALFRAIRYET